jgi:hypothetical protein
VKSLALVVPLALALAVAVAVFARERRLRLALERLVQQLIDRWRRPHPPHHSGPQHGSHFDRLHQRERKSRSDRSS